MKPLPLFVPVIHVSDTTQALAQAAVAFGNGADGIFLIDHGSSYEYLTLTYHEVRSAFPTEWIGLNYLDLHAGPALVELPESADGLWLDSVKGLSGSFLEMERTYRIFAPAAFKYQPQTSDLAAEARSISERFDVTTTSGPGTGQAASVSKVETMKLAIGERPLALASGVTVDNVLAYHPYVSCFMVATSLCRSFHEFEPGKVRAMADMIESAQGGIRA